MGVLLAEPFFLAQNSDPDIVGKGVAYLRICAGFSFGLFLEIMFERLLQSTGKTIYTMLSQGLGAVINLILDPLLIFGLGPFPAMGIAGAALATVIGQCVGALLGLFCNLRRNPEITISFRGFRPHGVTIRKIYAVGVPSIIMSSIGSVMTFGMNKILGAFNSTAVAVFSAYFKLESFIFMPVFGLNNGIVPIIAYNVPSRTGVNLKPEIVVELAKHPRIRGIKEASGNMRQIAELCRLAGDGLYLYAGDDADAFGVLALGGQGVISVAANVVPAAMHELAARFRGGEIAESRAMQLSLLPLIRALFCEVNPIPVKAALAEMGRIGEELRLPLTPLRGEKRAQLLQTLRDCALL